MVPCLVWGHPLYPPTVIFTNWCWNVPSTFWTFYQSAWLLFLESLCGLFQSCNSCFTVASSGWTLCWIDMKCLLVASHWQFPVTIDDPDATEWLGSSMFCRSLHWTASFDFEFWAEEVMCTNLHLSPSHVDPVGFPLDLGFLQKPPSTKFHNALTTSKSTHNLCCCSSAFH